jgi:hypothetical protein
VVKVKCRVVSCVPANRATRHSGTSTTSWRNTFIRGRVVPILRRGFAGFFTSCVPRHGGLLGSVEIRFSNQTV